MKSKKYLITIHKISLIIIFVLILFCILQIGCNNFLKKDPLTPEEREWLKQHDGKITLGHDPDAKPVDFLDDNGNFLGLAADYTRLIEKKLNFKFNIIHTKTWSEVVEKAKKNEIDVLCSFTKNPEREKYMLFTDPYIIIKVVILTTKDFKGTLTLDKMQNMRVSYTEGWIVDDYLNKYKDVITKVPAINDQVAMAYLLTNQVDAWVTALTVASNKIEENKVTNIRVAGETDLSFKIAFASRKDWPILNGILKKGLSLINEKERTNIFKKWIHINVENKISRELITALLIILIIIVVIIISILMWNFTLKRKVELRTFELNKELDERKRNEEKIAAALKEKEVLLREIHHRVKNNMQITSSLLSIQSKKLKNENDIELFNDIQMKIKTMLIVHERLYQSDDLSRINIKHYVNDLIDNLFVTYGVNKNIISAKVDIKDILFEVDLATSCGLVISELVSNCLKHAFPENKKGIIAVLLNIIGDSYELVVSDNGVGFLENMDFKTTESFGLNLVKILVEGQLGGMIEVNKTSGIKYIIKFKKPIYNEL